MKYWSRLTRKFSRKNHEGQLVLGRAYRAVFRGSPDRAQQEMVLADLAARCGFYLYTPSSRSEAELRHNEGKREAFSIIFNHLSLAPDDIAALENASRHETLDVQYETDLNQQGF